MNGGVVDAVTDTLWWTGWRPVLTISVFAVFGVLAGYFLDLFGVGTTVFGVVVVGVGVFLPTVRKTAVALSLAAAVVFFGIGTGTVVEAAARFGFDLRGLAEEVSVLVLEASSPDRVPTEPAGTVGGALAWLSASSLAGATAGVFVWLGCAGYVRRIHDGVREELVGTVSKAGEEVLGGEVYTLTNPHGTVPFVDSARRYDVANLLVGASSVSLHHGSMVDMVSRTVELGDGTEEIYYDRISSVGYDGRRLRIRTGDGNGVKMVTPEQPVELLEEMENRLQEYKKREQKPSENRGKGETESQTEDAEFSETETDVSEKYEEGDEPDSTEEDSDVKLSEVEDETDISDTEIDEILDDLDGVEEMLSEDEGEIDEETEDADRGGKE